MPHHRKKVLDPRVYHWTEYYETNVRWNQPLTSVEALPPIQGPALVVDAGPSLPGTAKHLKDFPGTVFATDRAFEPCVRAGRIPDYVVNVDASHLCLPFLLNETVTPAAAQVKAALFCITAHPLLIQRWRGLGRPAHFFLPMWPDDRQYLWAAELESRGMSLPTFNLGGNVLTTCWVLAHYLGANPIVLTGCDNGYLDPKKKEHTDVRLLLRTCNRKKTWTDEVYWFYSRLHLRMIKAATRKGLRTVNATEGGTIYGEGVEPRTLAEIIAELQGADTPCLSAPTP